jgi:hypothetical protein
MSTFTIPVQLYQAFFVCRKGDFLLTAKKVTTYGVSIKDFLRALLFSHFNFFNDYLTIYTIA